MALILVSELEVNVGTGSTEVVTYNNNEVNFVGSQTGATGVRAVNVRVKNAVPNKAEADTECTAILAVKNKAILQQDYHYAVLPCPPYCGKGG